MFKDILVSFFAADMDYIEIRGYKSIKDAKVEFRSINILIGANGSGKTNFLSFFEFLNRLYKRSLGDYIAKKGADKLLYRGPKITDTINFKTEFNNKLNGYSASLELGNDGFIFTDERLIYESDRGADISRSETESRISTTDNYRAKYIRRYFNSFRKYHFHDTGVTSPFSATSNTLNDINFLYERGDNLAAFLYSIRQKHEKVYRKIVDAIQSVAPFFYDFFLQPNEDGNLRLQWQDKSSSITYGPSDFSDGTIRFIALATLFLQPNLPATIIIDEPELGLHPFAISKLAGLIQAAASQNCQVIIATQSADLIGHFNPEDIVAVDQKDGATNFTRLDAEKYAVWLDEYTLDDLWKRNIITNGQPNY